MKTYKQWKTLNEVFKLNKNDKRVIDFFISKKIMKSNKLMSDGNRLDGRWMGGNGIATWANGKIVFDDLGSKAAQVVQNAIRKSVPKNDILEDSMDEATSKRVWQTPDDAYGTPHIFKGYKHQNLNPAIGWFSNKHNQAAGWGIYPMDKDDIAWFKQKKVSRNNVFRVATENTTSLVRFNFKTGTMSWLDNEHLMDTDEIKFQKATPYSKVILHADRRANKKTGLKYNDVPSTRELM